MSELKGTLLTMVLVIAVFGIIAAVLIPAFQQSAQDVASQITISSSLG
ncbi:MAG: type II secretion system GspH family protein [Bacilli bacterium]|nr:type II secretion system GspH family protein [Bacilli bacterium]